MFCCDTTQYNASMPSTRRSAMAARLRALLPPFFVQRAVGSGDGVFVIIVCSCRGRLAPFARCTAATPLPPDPVSSCRRDVRSSPCRRRARPRTSHAAGSRSLCALRQAQLPGGAAQRWKGCRRSTQRRGAAVTRRERARRDHRAGTFSISRRNDTVLARRTRSARLASRKA